MTLAIVTNFINHHTRYLAEALYARLSFSFYFVETESRNAGAAAEQKNFKQGFAYFFASEDDDKPCWLFQAYCEGQREICQKIIDESDVVIIANASDKWIYPRLKQKKLTFRAHERWYKKGLPLYSIPRSILGGWLHHSRFPSLYMLCSSAYTAWDASRVLCFHEKAYRWGYFPKSESLDIKTLFSMKQHRHPIILWAGRMVDWKHAEDALTACSNLFRQGYRFELQFAGNGDCEGNLRQRAHELDIESFIHFFGAVEPQKVRNYMERADIYLITSDFNEGWGVVVNEAMSCGCAVVGSHAAGAVPYLISDKKNGLIYESGNVDALEHSIKTLLDAPGLCRVYGGNAYQLISQEWSPDEAACRIIMLSKRLLAGNKGQLYLKGPCSKAPIIRNNWWPENNTRKREYRNEWKKTKKNIFEIGQESQN